MHKKMIKRLFCIMLIAVFAASLGGCGKQASEPNRLKDSTSAEGAASSEGQDLSDDADETADTETVSLADGVVALVNGEELRAEDFGYYLYNNAVIQLYKINPEMTSNVSVFDWSTPNANGTPLSEVITENAIEDAVNDTVFRQMAEKTGYSVSTAEETARELISDSISRNGEELFLNNAHALGISDAERYIKVYTNISIFDDIADDFLKNPNKYIDDVSLLYDCAGEKGASVQQILILSNTEKGDALTIAQEVYEKAKNGEDFSELMKEYNEDISDSDDEGGRVYTFPEGEMVSSFEEAAFALEIGEISGIVESNYGYHIIKRLCGAYELQNYWRKISDVTIAPNAAEMLDFDGVINMVKTAKAAENDE